MRQQKPDSHAEEPVKGIPVTAKFEGRVYQTTTSADGTYEFLGLPPGRFTITIEPDVAASRGMHLCFRAPNRAAVRAFHTAALASGGRDDGTPGLRALYHPDYFGAYVLDPDAHRIEAVCHAPEHTSVI